MAISSCTYLQALIISIGLLLGLASMLVAGEAPSSGYRVELIHVDGTTTTTKVVEAQHFSHYQYMVELQMKQDTDTDKFYVVADTGSDLVWMKQQSSPEYGSVRCGCKNKDVSEDKSQCCSSEVYTFNKTYGTDKKAAKGFICRNEVTLSPLMADKAIRMGIAIDYADYMLPASAHGILGLNRGNMSLLKQLKETNFSYCLSDPVLEPKRKNLFWFGGDVVDSTWQSTPLVQMPDTSDLLNQMYLIALLNISIGDGSGVLPKDIFKHKSKQGDGVMVVDSGTSHTHLEEPVFWELVNLLKRELGEPKFITKENKFSPGNKVYTCFSDIKNGKKPTLAFHLKEGKKGEEVKMRIPWNNYMVRDEADQSKFCLTINRTARSSVMGNILQHDIRMHFDLKQEELSFKPVTDCTMEQ